MPVLQKSSWLLLGRSAGGGGRTGVGRWQALRGWGSRVVDMARRPVAAGALLYISCTSALDAPAGGRGAVGVVSARCRSTMLPPWAASQAQLPRPPAAAGRGLGSTRGRRVPRAVGRDE
eukprot:COSAG01_NODE_4473_length_4989_cov_3.564826_1_plen_119_part_00